jgi:uncharacterized tellurite resistance protein B-like protein
MIDAIRRFVSRRTLPAPGTSESAAGTARPAGLPVRLAACALLLELAHADGEFTPDERAHIESALGRHFGLDPAEAQELITLADAERREAVDTFQFTRLIADQYDLGQKMVLAEVMWGVILADGTIADHEAYLTRKIAGLLQLRPAYLAEARRAAAGPE